ncbi:hypothetical protein NEA10_19420 [Phormidium yuhuli AB48]|uniref:Uncharacterized protein n=1 Tax=Phormidium yuhuli AB48 TaxID=2940671 RepID=A0ABY5APP4_9CYAN|nr:hypothetical protein [Phormidium yuhuli]USR90965.1 hypothetical protein NEA10_19420 [Phormidium yuhuli AB48]
MRHSLLLSALLLGLGSSLTAAPQITEEPNAEQVAFRGFLSAQTEQKDEVEPHRGSGRRRFQPDTNQHQPGDSFLPVTNF